MKIKLFLKIKLLNVIALILINCCKLNAQDTFSICAFDSVTGQVGSAGATCITSATVSALIISDVHPGVGVVHTQASWLAANQNYAKSLMNLGLLPQQIIDSLVAHDVQNNPSNRQYGIVSLAGGGLSAAYTGSNCLNYHNHITGPNYSIQGNILLGQQILDSMEARFLNTPGTLACKLMAALQGAKVPGADTRCLTFGISSYSAFVRVANTGDTPGNFFLDLTVNTYPTLVDPIDSLQSMFNSTGACGVSNISVRSIDNTIQVFPNPASDLINIRSENEIKKIEIISPLAIVLEAQTVLNTTNVIADISKLERGIYFLKVTFFNRESTLLKFIKSKN